jgi:hypothetical protein
MRSPAQALGCLLYHHVIHGIEAWTHLAPETSSACSMHHNLLSEPLLRQLIVSFVNTHYQTQDAC